MHKKYRPLFSLDPDVIYLNHGSFGACPKIIFDSLISFQKKLEYEPVKFLDEHLYEYLKESRKSLSEYINCDRDDVAFFPNPSTALNTLIRSLDLNKGDQILTTNHEYGALDRTWNFISKKRGCSTLQGRHQDAKKFISTFLSFRSFVIIFLFKS